MFKALRSAMGMGFGGGKNKQTHQVGGSRLGNREVGQTMGRSGGYKENKDNIFGGIKGDKRKVYQDDINLPLSGSVNPKHREIAKRQAPYMKRKASEKGQEKSGGVLQRIFESNPFKRAGREMDKITRRN